MKRGCGVLLPISSLPNKCGFGCFSREAYEFVDYLAGLGMKYWQILPLNPLDVCGSPYSSNSAFAGEPLYVDIEKYLDENELKLFKLNEKNTFENYKKNKTEALRSVFEKLYYTTDIDKFIEENECWVYDYAVYMVIQEKTGKTFSNFPAELKDTKSNETIEFIKEHSKEIIYYIFLQFLFFSQWKELKKYANEKGIKIIGDVPIYCSMDSVDMYAHRNCFLLDEKGKPTYISGVPGDYFNPEGQIWNNPLYDYEYMRETNYAWWIQRIKFVSKIYDYVRIDHFRGFESFYAVPYGDKTVKNGVWMKGPGIEIFNLFSKKGYRNLILEDLGIISDAVRNLKKNTGLAGMKVLQFAFDGDSNNLNLPQNYEKNSVAYLGTHDNDTFIGFLEDKTAKKSYCDYLGVETKISNKDLTRIAIENIISTNSNVCILTMQDILCEGRKHRINTPGTNSGNWDYHLRQDYKENEYNKYLKILIKNKNR